MIIKSIDHNGRLVIPRELLRSANIEPGAPVELYGFQTPDGDPAVIVKQYQDRCPFCNEVLVVGFYKKISGKKICNYCINDLKEELQEV